MISKRGLSSLAFFRRLAMSASLHSFLSLVRLAPAAIGLFTAPAYADQLIYVPLGQPCRLLDTRTSTGGAGPLTAAHGVYSFGTFDADIQSAAQHGNSAGCGIPGYTAAVSVNMNLLNTTASGNITTWSVDAGAMPPNVGTAVYNPSVSSAAPGQVQYNTGYTSIPVGVSSPGRFYLQVANGQTDMTINLVGYWLPISWWETRSGYHATAFGDVTTASGTYSTAMGSGTLASGDTSTTMGYSTIASSPFSTAMGYHTTAAGYVSTVMGYNTRADGEVSTAMGIGTTASGDYSTAMGNNTAANAANSTAMGTVVSTGGHIGSFIYGDSSHIGIPANDADNQFMVVASGGLKFYTNTVATIGAELPKGSGSWMTLSDRNAKTAVQPVDAREVLKKVTALPLNTWQYKAQEAKYRHVGPMAQDFYAAFQLGESDKGIDTVDADGVALAAIQGLNALLVENDAKVAARLDEKEHEITALRSEAAAQAKDNALLRAEMKNKNVQLTTLQARVDSLESIAADIIEMKTQLAVLRRSSPMPVSVALVQP